MGKYAATAHNPFTFTYDDPGPARGSAAPLLAGTEEVGRALRTRHGVKPVFVSVGHRMSLDNAVAHTLALTPSYRLPETTRRADALCRAALREEARREAGDGAREPSTRQAPTS